MGAVCFGGRKVGLLTSWLMAVPLMETNSQILKAGSICAWIDLEKEQFSFMENKTLIPTYLNLKGGKGSRQPCTSKMN